MEPYMTLDRYGRSTVRNLYFDTDDYILARHSIAKPDFKEKLRIRSYSSAGPEDTVFVELKRKYEHVVYKRRAALPEKNAMMWTVMRAGIGAETAAGSGSADPVEICGTDRNTVSPQMLSEIDYFLGYYKRLRPVVFLSYDREAYRMKGGLPANCGSGDFRVTFDSDILARDRDLTLGSEIYGEHVLEPGKVLMELKCSGGIPMWMTEVLSREKIYKTSFSKYGTVYQRMIQPGLRTAYAESGYSPVYTYARGGSRRTTSRHRYSLPL